MKKNLTSILIINSEIKGKKGDPLLTIIECQMLSRRIFGVGKLSYSYHGRIKQEKIRHKLSINTKLIRSKTFA
jgi:hypothetical protein